MTDQPEIRVRTLSTYDFPDLRKLMAELPGDEVVPDGDEGEAIMYEILALQGLTLIGAEADGHIVATAMLSILPNLTHGGRPLARIENVVALPQYRGMGYGKAVVEEALKRARKAGCVSVSLLTPPIERLVDFHRSLGFTTDMVGMRLEL